MRTVNLNEVETGLQGSACRLTEFEDDFL